MDPVLRSPHAHVAPTELDWKLTAVAIKIRLLRSYGRSVPQSNGYSFAPNVKQHWTLLRRVAISRNEKAGHNQIVL